MAIKDGSKLSRAKGRYAEFSERFKLGPHYTIERFGIAVALVTVTGLFFATMAACSDISAGRAVLGARAMYTTDFTTSRTGVSGSVEGVYRNKDHNRVLVMMKFEDPTQMSSDADDYYVYGSGIDGSKPTPIAKPLVGEIYSFGSTGYLGVMLEAPEGFAPQLLNLTIRAKKELMSVDESALPANSDPSFSKYDQWRVVVNPAGSSAVWLHALDSEKLPSATDVYADAVLWPQEVAQRRKLDTLLADMKAQLTRISTLESQMATTSVQLGKDPNVRLLRPSLPKEIEGDTITGMSAAELKEELTRTPVAQIEGIGDKTPRARRIDTYENGTLPNTYVLHSEQTMAGGLDFDWRSRTVSDGYFEKMGTGKATISEYLASRSEEKPASSRLTDLDWELSNGKSLNDIAADDVDAAPLITLRNNALQAYSQYHSLKRKYQVTELAQLLVMESDLDNVDKTATIASGPEAVAFRS